MKKSKIGIVVSHIYLMILTLISIFPLVWIFISSLKSKGELTGNPTAFWPEKWTLDYYIHVIKDLNFLMNIKNSVMISLVTTIIAITVASLAAYGIVRFFKKLGSAMSKMLVTTYIFPPILLAIPYSIVMGKLGFTNTRVGLVIVYLSFSVPYAVWLLTGFFRNVPIEIEEAARIDGANKLQTFIRVVLPLVAPGVVATAIYTFINTWNEFLYALILMNDSKKMTVAVALRSLDGAEILDWGDMMAASALVVFPSVIFFCFIQNKIAGGMSDGAVKS